MANPCSNNCGRFGSHSRGLCRRCYDDPFIRLRFPAKIEGCNRKGVLDFMGTPPPPTQATATRPGSPARKRVYARRAEAGCGIFHQDDTRLEDDE